MKGPSQSGTDQGVLVGPVPLFWWLGMPGRSHNACKSSGWEEDEKQKDLSC